MFGKMLKRISLLLLILISTLLIWGYAGDIPAEKLRVKYANGESEFVTLNNGLTVHLRDEGPVDAPAIILLHGSNASLHTWDAWTERLKGRYRIIRYDQAGHGLTGPHPANCYTRECFARIVEAVADNRGLDHFILAGNSMGGGIAYHYAQDHGDRLNGLILVDAAGAPEDKSRKLPIGFRIMTWPVINRLSIIITPRSVIEKSIHGSVSRSEFVDDAEVDLYWELIRHPGNRDATVRRFATYARENAELATKAKQLDIPTLILWGEEDRLIPVAAVKWCEAKLPIHESIIYPATGHIPMQEVTDESAADVDRWIVQNELTG